MSITATDLVRLVKNGKEEDFRRDISKYIKGDNIMNFIIICNEIESKRATQWCQKEKIYLIHKIFEKVTDLPSISFLRPYTYFDKLDLERRTWLHIAVIHDRDIEILRFLVEVKGISIISEDDYGYTPLHYYCQKDKYDMDILSLLLKNQDHLIKPSGDGITPLELSCGNKENLKLLKSMSNVDIKSLLRTVDNISKGVMEVGTYSLAKLFSKERIWLNILQKDDHNILLSYIKNDENFLDKYFLNSTDMLSIIKKCPENGQGILTYIKVSFIKNQIDPNLNVILSALTGVKIKECDNQRTFYKCALFLVIITGRLGLVSTLLRSCPFEIIPFSMLICLICKNLETKNIFPEQVIQDLCKLKEFCENYAIAVMYRTHSKDLSVDKTVIRNYITRNIEPLYGRCILEVAYRSRCTQYLSLPICQESFRKTWNEPNGKGPRIKFWFHSITHVIFLILLSCEVFNHNFVQISLLESLCYVYVLGYLMEELRQIYLSTKANYFYSYFINSSNVIDFFALLLMFFGFLSRFFLLPEKENSLFVSRLFLCLSLILFSMKVLHFFSVNKVLGPKLKMISQMILKDLIPLIFIFMVFLTSFGLIFQSFLYPNNFYMKENSLGKNITWGRKSLVFTIGDILRRSIFTVFDLYYTLDEIESSQNDNTTDNNGRVAVYFFLFVFMVVVNVMLMNLLIALLSETVSRISEKSNMFWMSSRYGFIQEYSWRTLAPPPFNIIIIIIEILIMIIKRIINRNKRDYKNKLDFLLQQFPQISENSEEYLSSYYIYQAFAISGQRYRLVKDIENRELEKEVDLKIIERRLRCDHLDIKRILNERCRAVENKINFLSKKNLLKH